MNEKTNNGLNVKQNLGKVSFFDEIRYKLYNLYHIKKYNCTVF